MTKEKQTKKTLLTSVLSLVLCVAMLVGTTFAWFTDSVSSNGNKIVAGDLDVQLWMHDGNDYVDISDAEKPIFGNGSLAQNNQAETLWEPGKTQIVYLAVKNAGSLALKYNILVDVKDEGLVGALKYAIVDGVTKSDVDTYGIDSWSDITAVQGVQVGDIVSGRTIAAENGGIEAAGWDYFALAVHMDESAGNEFKNKSVVIDINILATQMEYEADSFDNTYDAGAELDTTEGMAAKIGNRYFESLQQAFDTMEDGDTVELLAGYNTQDKQLTESIVIDKDITLIPNGMYLVSNAESTFTVCEGGKLTVTEGSFTIKNTATNGAAVYVDGGEFVMAGGSFDAHTAVKTAEGKSSTVTIAAGWSNRVTVGVDSKGNDTINVTGGSLYTSGEAIKTAADTHVELNMRGGLLSSGVKQVVGNGAAVALHGTADVNITGGTIASTYKQNDLNASTAIQAYTAPTNINISGDAKVTALGYGVVLGKYERTPEVLDERFVLNVSGNAEISVNGGSGMGIRFAKDACDVTISGNAKVSATYHAIQMNFNGNGVSYVFANSYVTVSENATITSTAGRYGGGYAVAASGNVTITGGTINGTTAGLAAISGAVIVVDNSQSGTPISINSTDIADGVDYTVAGDPSIG